MPSAKESVGRARFCLTCRKVVQDGPRHTHTMRHEYRKLTPEESSALLLTKQAALSEGQADYVFTFGKHYRRTLQYVLDHAPSYIVWAIREKVHCKPAYKALAVALQARWRRRVTGAAVRPHKRLRSKTAAGPA